MPIIVATIEGVEKILSPSKKRIGWSKIKVEFSEPFYPLLSYKDASLEKKIFKKFKINKWNWVLLYRFLMKRNNLNLELHTTRTREFEKRYVSCR